jgi:hypothetical protein
VGDAEDRGDPVALSLGNARFAAQIAEPTPKAYG